MSATSFLLHELDDHELPFRRPPGMVERRLVLDRIVARLGAFEAREPRHDVARPVRSLELQVAAARAKNFPPCVTMASYQRHHSLTCAQLREVMEATRSGVAMSAFQASQQAATMVS